jgi:SAM-dependent methyltransferase
MAVREATGAIAKWIILQAQKTNRKGLGGYSEESFAIQGDTRPFPQADSERAQFEDFFGFFPDFDLKGALRDKEVLDFGCGYGGKTVEYKLQCEAKRVCGVEPFEHVIELSRKYAESRGAHGVEFKVCGHTEIPYPDASFDVVLSHDVLEHVQDPRLSLAEIRRVLRPGGLSVNVFPVYLGAFSHHLDYIVRVPGLHWVFSPRTLVRAVNYVLARNPQFGTALQPEPGRSFDGSREVLPSLNGLSGEHFDTIFQGFEVLSLKRRIFLSSRVGLGWITTTLAYPSFPHQLRDAVTSSVSCILRKPA